MGRALVGEAFEVLGQEGVQHGGREQRRADELEQGRRHREGYLNKVLKTSPPPIMTSTPKAMRRIVVCENGGG
jgi:hypothetical protein